MHGSASPLSDVAVENSDEKAKFDHCLTMVVEAAMEAVKDAHVT